MGSVGKIVEGFDVDETIFVAVGDDFEKFKTMLFWTIQNFSGKKICLVHVHRPSRATSWNRKLAVGKFKPQNADREIEHFESPKLELLLEPYLFLLSEAGVHGEKLCIATYNVEEGIVELIVQHDIKWLVMGAASDKYYSRKMTRLKSKKASFVCKEAPISCHIWFVCKGFLIYTSPVASHGIFFAYCYYKCNRNVTNRTTISESRNDINAASPLLLLDSSRGTEQSADLQSAPVMRGKKFQALLQSRADAGEDRDESERDLRGSTSSWSQDSGFSTSDAVVPYQSTRLTDEEESQGHATFDCVKALVDAKKSKRTVFKTKGNRWKGEDCAEEAKSKSEALESLSVKEMRRRAELEELLQREKEEIEKIKNQNDEAVKELQMVRDLNVGLKNQIVKMQGSEKELEEKILSAVELLISFKQKRDDMRIQHDNATRKVKALGKRVVVEAGCSPGQIQEFSFEEIIEATSEFDPSCKIGEDKYGSVYKSVLHHVPVAIKMFPSYGPQSVSEIQDQVKLVTKLRHPNLVTLIGTCWESRSLVYEYMHNGSLEDHLSCSGNSPTLSWQTRARIASEVCSALLFLHSNRPCITHGNLKPSKILLDLNFVSKISDYGVIHMTLQDKTNSAYMDPNFFETGKVTPESDIYSFGIILLQLLTRRAIPGVIRDVQCALESGNFDGVLDHSAGDWSLAPAKELARLAVRCCETNHLNRPRLSEILRVLDLMKASFFSQSSPFSVPREQRKAPSHFLCPIFQDVMKDPLIAADGFTYEAEAIREWITSGHDTSPMTNLKMENCNLIPNHALHQAIQEWQQMW